MTPICTTLEQIAKASKTDSISPRTAAIISKVLENTDYIDKWPKGRWLLNWKGNKVNMQITKIE